jgi:hypothetical protein
MQEIGKLFMIVGFFLFIIGLVFSFSDKLPFSPGRLPGDIFYQKGNFSFYFPITTSIILSLVLSLLLYFFSKFFR